jgi:hypothetical protein
MSGRMKVLVIASLFIAGLGVMLLIGPAQAAKPGSVLSLMASFEPTWIDGSPNRIRNDVDGTVFVNTPSTKRAFYGVDVTYTPSKGPFPGQFIMKIDKNGLLGRSVKIGFQDPSTDPDCDDTDGNLPGLSGIPIDPLQGEAAGEIETMRIEISTTSVLVEDANGWLVRDGNQPLDMDKMQAGQSKFIGLEVTFTPTDPLFDRDYYLGVLMMDPTPCMDSYAFLGGPAELFCTVSGSEWEIRPTTRTFVNEPDNLRRLLHTDYQLDWLHSIELRTWKMPFILRIWK